MKPAPKPRLIMEGVTKSFGATRALRSVDFELYPGEILALVGENGAGKSTLMKVLSGAHQPDTGTMVLNGSPYRPKNPLSARTAGIGMIYQELSLAPHLSVMENIFLGMEPTIGPLINWKQLRQRTQAALAEIGLAELDPGIEVSKLSIAKQQMVEIARAVALDCNVLVLDEPTSSLTQTDIKKLFALIRKLQSDGISVIYISHFLEEVKEISDRITVIRDGESVGSRITAEVEPDEIVALMVGRDVDDLYPRSERPSEGEVALEISSLSGVELPNSASLKLRRGQVMGVSGLVGAGRTEMMRAIFGLDKIKRGSVTIGTNLPLKQLKPVVSWGLGVGMVSEDRKQEGLALNLSIADNVTLAKLDGLGPGGLVSPGKQSLAAQRWIERVQVKCAGPFQKIGALSGGNQQKIAIARLLHADVDVLLLDEPTRGIDVGSKAQIYRLIDDLAKGDPETGRAPKAILLISSYLPELLGVCDQICVMCRGALSEAKPVEEWDQQQLMLVATGQE